MEKQIAGAGSATSALTILLVEDEQLVRDVTREALERKGYHVWEADSPEAAMAIVSQQDRRLDLLLTDFLMPEMNGLALAERLVWLYPGLVTILMSGYAAHDLVSQLNLPPATFYLQKPFSLDVLLRQVSDALARRSRLNAQDSEELAPQITAPAASHALQPALTVAEGGN